VRARFTRGSGSPGSSFRAHSNSDAAEYSSSRLKYNYTKELVSDPLLSLGEVGLGSPGLQQQLAGETGPQNPEEVDTSAANVAFEQGQLSSAEIIPEPILLNTGS